MSRKQDRHVDHGRSLDSRDLGRRQDYDASEREHRLAEREDHFTDNRLDDGRYLGRGGKSLDDAWNGHEDLRSEDGFHGAERDNRTAERDSLGDPRGRSEYMGRGDFRGGRRYDVRSESDDRPRYGAEGRDLGGGRVRYEDGVDNDRHGTYEGRSDWRTQGDMRTPRMTRQHVGKGPKGYQRSDDRLREDASDALTRDGEVDASEIEVQVSSGEITLTGTVLDRAQKRAAEECVERIEGVHDVHNQIRVLRPGAEASSQDANARKTTSSNGLTSRGGSSKSKVETTSEPDHH